MHLPTYTVALLALVPAAMGAVLTPREPQFPGMMKELGEECVKDDECYSAYCGEDKKCRTAKGESCEVSSDCHGFSYFCSPDKVCLYQGGTGEGDACKYNEECGWGRCDKGICDKGKGQFGSPCEANEECTGKNPLESEKMICAKSPFIGNGRKVCRGACRSKHDCEGKVYPDDKCVATGLPCLKSSSCCRGHCSWLNELPIPTCHDD